MKQVVFAKEAKQRIKTGIDIVVNSIKSTLGPKGRNAFIDKPLQPLITNDGATIAHEIVLKDKLENMGAWLVKNTSAKTNDDAGDGTSTTSVLLQAIIDEAEKRSESPMDIKRSLLETGKEVEAWIKSASKPVKNNEQIQAIATISAESEETGKLIADVINAVGHKVPINIEDSRVPEITFSVVDGLETKVGYIHPAFANNEKERTAEYEDIHVFATDRRIGSVPELQVLLETIQANKISSLVFLVSDIDNGVLNNFLMSKMQGAFNPLVIRASGDDLEDMASACGATLISDGAGLKFSDIKMEHLGRAKKIVATEKKTIITSYKSDKTQNAINALRRRAEQTKNMYEQERFLHRADALESGVAVIHVGAQTDSEREYLKFKIEDAVNATKSAIAEGVVDGGGMCLYRMSNKIKGNSIGEDILRNALKEPLKAIIENAGKDYTSIVKKMTSDKGYDARNDKIVNMAKEGIIDPTKVVRSAFMNSLSTAANYITMSVAIAEEEKNETTTQ